MGIADTALIHPKDIFFLKDHPKWLFRPKLNIKPVMPNITPFLSASHLCFALPEQCGARAFLRNRGKRLRWKKYSYRDILRLYKTLPQLLVGRERWKERHDITDAWVRMHRGWGARDITGSARAACTGPLSPSSSCGCVELMRAKAGKYFPCTTSVMGPMVFKMPSNDCMWAFSL